MFKLLRKTSANVRILWNTKHKCSTFHFLDLDNSTNKNYAIIKMKKKPVNSINLDMVKEIISALDMVEKNKQFQGVMFTSALPVFCAGLDILEMYKPEQERLRMFWYHLQELVIKLYSSHLFTLSVINGSCLAGGCIFAFTSDTCIMANNDTYRIGLSATKLGLPVPIWLLRLLISFVGHREAELMATLSLLLSPHQALEKGLVSKIVEEDRLMISAMQEMEQWLQIDDLARISTKLQCQTCHSSGLGRISGLRGFFHETFRLDLLKIVVSKKTLIILILFIHYNS